MAFIIEDFIFNTPLYSNVIVSIDTDYNELSELFDRSYKKTFDGFNPYERKESTFMITSEILQYSDSYLRNGGINTVKMKCKRTEREFFFFILWIPKDNTLIKIGQFPSIADFHIYEIKQYKKLLPNGKLTEFTRAIGLAANGVGIGSFVYLRRIFEYLIYQAYEKAKQEGKLDDSIFQPSRMDKKIELLREYLPDFLVQNKSLYSILSKGIHELSEKDCLDHFDTLRVGIEIILDEQLDELRKKEKIAEAKKKLDLLKGNLKN